MAQRKPARRETVPAPAEGRERAVIENLTPQVDGGRFAVKRIVGDRVEVEADCFTDGHDVLACRLRFRRDDDRTWQESPMTALGNDRWRGEFTVDAIGRYRYTVSATGGLKCSSALRLVKSFIKNHKAWKAHGDGTSAGTYYTNRNYKGWRCGEGSGGGSCWRGKRYASYQNR